MSLSIQRYTVGILFYILIDKKSKQMNKISTSFNILHRLAMFTISKKQYYTPHTRTESKFERNRLNEVNSYLYHWKTIYHRDNITFFHLIDELMFEMAVRGYFKKSFAVMFRYFMEDLIAAGYEVPHLI